MDTELAGDTGLLMIAPSPMLTVRPFITQNAVLTSRLSFSNTPVHSSPIVMSESIITPASIVTAEFRPMMMFPLTSCASLLTTKLADGCTRMFVRPPVKLTKRRPGCFTPRHKSVTWNR